MICGKCGKENPEGARFCAFCAQPLVGEEKPSPRRRDGGAVDASGRKTAPPARKRPVDPRASTIIPRRKRKETDLFFEDIAMPRETPYEDAEEGGERGHKIRSAVAGVLLLVVLGVVFWLLALPGGQAFRAGLGLDAPASAHATLGDRHTAEGSVRRAAEAYYKALVLDPENYDYALKVGQTQTQIGDYDKALSAYALCIKLKETASEPYRAVADIYVRQGRTDYALSALSTGYDRTGNLDLFRAYEAMKAQGNAGE